MLLVRFWPSSIVDCVCKHVHTKLLQPRLLATCQGSVKWLALGTWGRLCHHWPVIKYYIYSRCKMLQCLSTYHQNKGQTDLHSALSVKFPFFRKAATVMVDLTRKDGGRGRMHKMDWILEQTPPPSFCLKKGERGRNYSTSIQVPCKYQNSSCQFPEQ